MRTTLLAGKREIWTDEELEALPKDGHKYELLDGELMMSPVHLNHGLVCVRLSSALFHFVEARGLGQVLDSSIGCRLADDLLLSPDVAFVSKERLNKIGSAPEKFLAGAPDLVVEVFSPSDRMKQVNRKLDHYFEHGARLAWLVHLRKQQIQIYTADSIETLTDLDDVLTGGLVLPGFKCKLRKIFLPG
jgi:Uma2 family endonuclease